MGIDTQRGTGRTKRMIAEANRLASAGYAVAVVVATEWQREHLRPLLAQHVRIAVASSIAIDWDAMRLRDMSPESRTLFDHYAIEHRFSRLLKELHRFD